MTTTRDLERALAENAELLANVNADLDRMPRFKRGTRWHTDRTSARQDLLRRREMLRGQLRQLAASN